MHNTSMYTTTNLFQQNICYSCGSYQCPYCPYFNVATVMKGTITLLTFAAGFLLKCFALRSWDRQCVYESKPESVSVYHSKACCKWPPLRENNSFPVSFFSFFFSTVQFNIISYVFRKIQSLCALPHLSEISLWNRSSVCLTVSPSHLFGADHPLLPCIHASP